MSAEYSMEEVRNAARLLDGLSRRMLNDYAERIKADERAAASIRPKRCSAHVIHPKPSPPGPGNPPLWCCLREGHDGPHRHDGGGMYPSIPFRENDEVSMIAATHPPAQAAQVDVIGHPRGANEQRDEIELYLRDAYAAGCLAAQSRSMVMAMEYAHREAPKLRAIVKPTAEPVAQPSIAPRCDKPGCNCATWKPEGCAWDDAEPVVKGEVMVDFAGIGFAGPFPIKDGKIELSQVTLDDLCDRIPLSAQPRAVPDGLTADVFGGWCNLLTHAWMYVQEGGKHNAWLCIEQIEKEMRDWQRKLAAAPSPGES